MADTTNDTKPEGGSDGGDDPLEGITPDEQKRLLDDPPEGADDEGFDPKVRKALDSIKEQRQAAREARNTEKKRADELAARLKAFEDKDKSELERATGERDTYRTRAEAAEARIARRELAEELAPDHATAKQIAQVAKRLQGDTDAAMRADAEELFALVAPAPSGNGKAPANKPPGAPKERLRGGADPDGNDPGEMDPYKLAALVKRRA